MLFILQASLGQTNKGNDLVLVFWHHHMITFHKHEFLLNSRPGALKHRNRLYVRGMWKHIDDAGRLQLVAGLVHQDSSIPR
jgi:hypothetical protein